MRISDYFHTRRHRFIVFCRISFILYRRLIVAFCCVLLRFVVFRCLLLFFLVFALCFLYNIAVRHCILFVFGYLFVIQRLFVSCSCFKFLSVKQEGIASKHRRIHSLTYYEGSQKLHKKYINIITVSIDNISARMI